MVGKRQDIATGAKDVTEPRPRSVTVAATLLWSLVGASGLAALLVWVQHDDLVVAWAQGNRAARDLLVEGGLPALEASPIVPSFVPLALVAFVVFAMLAWVLIAFFVEGHQWARLALSATVVFLAFSGIVAIVAVGTDMPWPLMVLAGASLLLDALALVFLWRRETNAWFASF